MKLLRIAAVLTALTPLPASAAMLTISVPDFFAPDPAHTNPAGANYQIPGVETSPALPAGVDRIFACLGNASSAVLPDAVANDGLDVTLKHCSETSNYADVWPKAGSGQRIEWNLMLRLPIVGDGTRLVAIGGGWRAQQQINKNLHSLSQRTLNGINTPSMYWTQNDWCSQNGEDLIVDTQTYAMNIYLAPAARACHPDGQATYTNSGTLNIKNMTAAASATISIHAIDANGNQTTLDRDTQSLFLPPFGSVRLKSNGQEVLIMDNAPVYLRSDTGALVYGWCRAWPCPWQH